MSIPNYYNNSVVLGYGPTRLNSTSVRVQSTPVKNQNYQSYKVLRDQIVDKVQEFVLALDNSHSSLNQFVKLLRNRYGAGAASNIVAVMNKLSQNTDKILLTNNSDDDEFFKTMREFTKNISNLHAEITPYLSTSDTMDELNPSEANYSLIRFINDFNMLDKTESEFPKSFRSAYVKDMLKNNP